MTIIGWILKKIGYEIVWEMYNEVFHDGDQDYLASTGWEPFHLETAIEASTNVKIVALYWRRRVIRKILKTEG